MGSTVELRRGDLIEFYNLMKGKPQHKAGRVRAVVLDFQVTKSKVDGEYAVGVIIRMGRRVVDIAVTRELENGTVTDLKVGEDNIRPFVAEYGLEWLLNETNMEVVRKANNMRDLSNYVLSEAEYDA